ncbi:unnamed protein product [Mytilus edulis]|uniref:Reverse transcriptase RNase H-like domain-containing protein n=1 Tax=Mytilus edulis TaxID=6550 RepID=A0A8S3U9A6_MYTED|nr:unnamed protein product [Mytilus edulis]
MALEKENTYMYVSIINPGSQENGQEQEQVGYIFEQLCTTSEQTNQVSRLEHHIFDGHWVARPSKPHPMLLVNMTPLPEDHSSFGHPIQDTSQLKTITMSMVADTGCQSSIIPLQSANSLGITEKDLIPVKLVMRGAIKEDLGVIGAVAVSVTTKDTTSSAMSTRLLCYVSDTMEKAFICREALISLGIIHTNFPNVSTVTSPNIAASMENSEDVTCSCPRRRPSPPPVPTSLPPGLKATEEHVESLKEWLLDYYGATTFNVCEHQPLPLMNCEPLQLHVDPNATPVAVHKPALVPIHWQDKVYADLERDVRIGVLEQVSQNTPTTWCSRMVVTSKADGTPRRTVDLQPQNRHSVRQTHHVPSPFHLADRPQGMKKTVTDAWNGYHSVPIREEDRHFTTFITPWGRYRYKVAPQGFMASGDAYNQRFDAIISNFNDKDLITQQTYDQVLSSLMQLATSQHQLTLLVARAWFGLINQGAYAFAMARQMKPFRALLKPSTTFCWTNELDEVFHKSKEIIIQEMKEGVRLFDPARMTCLATDWSVDGIGFFLMQKYCQCSSKTPTCCNDGWKLCLVGSRFTHPAESRYAPIEGEALAVVYALHQTRYYVLGCKDLLVATDHKPLLQILNDRSLTDIDNRRLLNLKEKTLGYRFTILHVPGRKNLGPDAASRYPVGPPDRLNLPGEAPELDSLVNMTAHYHDTLTSLCLHTEDNDTANDASTVAAATCALNAVITVVTWNMVRSWLGLKDYKELPTDLRPYHRFASSLCTVDGVVLMGQRIVIPPALRKPVLNALHAAHQGVSAMRARAMDSVYWPEITVDIARVRDQCVHCHQMAKSNPMQPPSDITPPDYPFQMICSDYFTYNSNDYVVIVDRYSNWPMVYKSESGAEGLVKRLRETSVHLESPEELTSDEVHSSQQGRLKSF